MKKRNLCLFLTSLLLAPAVFFTLPHQTGQTQEPESPGAIFTVTNNLNTGAGSFRQAIIDANAAAGLDTIRFQIGTGPVEINHNTALPDITQPVIIDGTTQPGFSGTPLITLAGNFTVGLKIISGASTVKALALSGFQNGVVLENAGGNIVTGNFIGICPQNPTASCGNFGKGVLINNSPNNRIGGATTAERNIIAGNADNGVAITGAASSGNLILGNYIGLRLDGTLAPNDNFGVAIIGAPNNRVGGSLAGERNVISGNAGLCNLPPIANNSDVFISGATASGNTVEGNYIGTTIDGLDANSPCVGVRIDNAPNNTIGGTVGTTPGGACTGVCNLISGYGGIGNQSGVTIAGSGSTGNSVLGNFIGTNAAGTARVNNDVSITITNGASNNTVGGTTAAGRNLINNGITLLAGAAANTVQGNYIGADTTGNTGIGFIPGGGSIAAVTIANSPNNRIGSAAGTTLGGACTGGCNLISGNNLLGVHITGATSTGNRVDYNYIGLNAAGTAALRNNGDAITLQGGANNNIIGRPVTATPFQEKEACLDSTALTVICIQDDGTGNWVQFDDVTGAYTWKHCRSGVTMSGSGEVIRNGTLVRLRGNGVAIAVNTSTGLASVAIVPWGTSLNNFFINDRNISNNTCVCSTEGIQTIVGTVITAGNSNVFNFVSIGSSANGLVNLSSPTADGNLLHLWGNSDTYSNLLITTNGANPAITIAEGTDNSVTGVNWSGVGPGSMVNYVMDLNDNQTRDPNDPLDADGGANRTQNHPTISFVRRQLIGDTKYVIVNAQFQSTPNTSFNIYFDISTRRYSTFFPNLELTEIEEGVFRTVTTDANGNASLEVDLFESEAAAIFSGKSRIVARASVVTQVPITSANPTGVILGDTSEYSPPVAVPQPKFDRDNDGKTDFIVYRPGANAGAFSFWYVLNSSNFTFQAVQFGNGEDLPVAGDWQGDGVMDLAVWRPSNATWYYSRITGNPTTNYESIPWGSPSDKSVVGDFDGDGANDAAIFRPANGTWWIRQSLGGGTFVQSWGLGSDKLVPADYDGDGDTDIAVYRNGTWYISVCPTCPARYEQFGVGTDVPVPGDYDGDGRADIAVWRPSDGIWYILRSTAGFTANRFGLPTDKALNGDFDADGKNDLAVWRPSDGIFYVLRSEQGFAAVRWGLSSDVPVSMFPNQ